MRPASVCVAVRRRAASGRARCARPWRCVLAVRAHDQRGGALDLRSPRRELRALDLEHDLLAVVRASGSSRREPRTIRPRSLRRAASRPCTRNLATIGLRIVRVNRHREQQRQQQRDEAARQAHGVSPVLTPRIFRRRTSARDAKKWCIARPAAAAARRRESDCDALASDCCDATSSRSGMILVSAERVGSVGSCWVSTTSFSRIRSTRQLSVIDTLPVAWITFGPADVVAALDHVADAARVDEHRLGLRHAGDDRDQPHLLDRGGRHDHAALRSRRAPSRANTRACSCGTDRGCARDSTKSSSLKTSAVGAVCAAAPAAAAAAAALPRRAAAAATARCSIVVARAAQRAAQQQAARSAILKRRDRARVLEVVATALLLPAERRRPHGDRRDGPHRRATFSARQRSDVFHVDGALEPADVVEELRELVIRPRIARLTGTLMKNSLLASASAAPAPSAGRSARPDGSGRRGTPGSRRSTGRMRRFCRSSASRAGDLLAQLQVLLLAVVALP